MRDCQLYPHNTVENKVDFLNRLVFKSESSFIDFLKQKCPSHFFIGNLNLSLPVFRVINMDIKFIQGYPHRTRIQRRLFRNNTVCFLKLMILWNYKLVSFFSQIITQPPPQKKRDYISLESDLQSIFNRLIPCGLSCI